MHGAACQSSARESLHVSRRHHAVVRATHPTGACRHLHLFGRYRGAQTAAAIRAATSSAVSLKKITLKIVAATTIGRRVSRSAKLSAHRKALGRLPTTAGRSGRPRAGEPARPHLAVPPSRLLLSPLTHVGVPR